MRVRLKTRVRMSPEVLAVGPGGVAAAARTCGGRWDEDLKRVGWDEKKGRADANEKRWEGGQRQAARQAGALTMSLSVRRRRCWWWW